MLVFPQLSTGASGQFPITRIRTRRTVTNELPDGRTVRYGDDIGEVAWNLDLRDLSSTERAAVETLFTDTEGRLRAFTFLDPADNLLRFSEVFTHPAWTKDPLLTVTSGVTDILATQRASHLVNGGQAGQGFSQTLGAPGSFTYCMSAWVKGSGSVTVSISTTGATSSSTFVAQGAWTRIEWGANPGLATESTTFRLALDAGAAVDLYGVQVEAQPSASGYKQTGAQGGVYANARFAADELRISADGPERERAQIGIVAVTGL